MQISAPESGAGNVCYSCLDDIQISLSRSRIGHLWDLIVHWFCPTVEGEAKLQFYKLSNSESEWDKMDAFLNLRGMLEEGCQSNFVIGKNEQDGTGRLSIQVDGSEVWSLDFSCVVGLHQEVERFGKTFVEAVRQYQGPDNHESCEYQTDQDLPRVTVTIEGKAFRYCPPKEADPQRAEADHIGAVKSALGACLKDQRLYEAVVRLLNQGSFGPLTKLHVEGQPQGAHGSFAGSPVGNLVGSYHVKSTKNGAEIVFSQANASIKHLYINFELVPTDSAVSYARSEFTVHLNHQGEITHWSPAKIHSEYRFIDPQHYLDALHPSAS